MAVTFGQQQAMLTISPIINGQVVHTFAWNFPFLLTCAIGHPLQTSCMLRHSEATNHTATSTHQDPHLICCIFDHGKHHSHVLLFTCLPIPRIRPPMSLSCLDPANCGAFSCEALSNKQPSLRYSALLRRSIPRFAVCICSPRCPYISDSHLLSNTKMFCCVVTLDHV